MHFFNLSTQERCTDSVMIATLIPFKITSFAVIKLVISVLFQFLVGRGCRQRLAYIPANLQVFEKLIKAYEKKKTPPPYLRFKQASSARS